jgi:putative DNA primase/helicase
MRGTVYTPLAKLAADHKVAVLGIDHLNKSDKKTVYRVSGSIATIAAARAAWVFAKDRQDESRRLMLPIKNNLAGDQEGLAYRIEEVQLPCENGGTIPTIRVAWEEGAVRVDVDEALSDAPETEGASALDEAVDWLKAQLVEPRESAWLREQAERDGLSWSTVKRAQLKLGVKPEKVGDHWMWPAIKKTERVQ